MDRRHWTQFDACMGAICCCAALLFAAGPALVLAQEYPSRPIRFVVPYPPGGPTDPIARLVGQKLHESMGQPVIVDNRAGGASIVGTEVVAKAAPDGHTMLMGTFAFAVTPNYFDKMPYDTLRDFAPVGLLAKGMLVLVVHPSVAAKSVKELIALAKSRPGKLNYASTGAGTSSGLGALLFLSLTGTNMTEINYKGAGPGLTGLLAGEVHVAFYSTPPALPLIKQGRLRVLGVTGAKRTRALPDVPTIAEAGVPGYEESAWYGILMPARTPQAVVAKLNRELVRVVQAPDIRETFIAQGLDPYASSPEEFGSYLASEVAKWSKVIKETGGAQKLQ